MELIFAIFTALFFFRVVTEKVWESDSETDDEIIPPTPPVKKPAVVKQTDTSKVYSIFNTLFKRF